jgi:hypothetical protein
MFMLAIMTGRVTWEMILRSIRYTVSNTFMIMIIILYAIWYLLVSLPLAVSAMGFYSG